MYQPFLAKVNLVLQEGLSEYVHHAVFPLSSFSM